MLKKTVLALATAATVTAAALAPTTASATYYGYGYSPYIKTHFYGGYYAPRFKKFCHWRFKRVWTYYGWKVIKFRKCRLVRVY